MTTATLSTTYFGPVQWYQKLCCYDRIFIERHDSYVKQTYRNRCYIATTNGVQALTVPVTVCASEGGEGSEIRISDHGNWRRQHWQALQTAYGDSPFFEYYEDDLRPFFTQRWILLHEFNEAIRQKICDLIDIQPKVAFTSEYLLHPENDLREAIQPKHPRPDADFLPRPYYQVYRQKHGFLPNLSILDLLFNMGPESIFLLL